jgi:hypothetical protein
MRLFDWLKPSRTPKELTRDYVNINTSALAQMLERGQKVAVEQEYPEAQRIADSLRNFPDDWGWHAKGYEIKHFPSGFILWVANKEYGLKEVIANGGKSEFAEPERAIIWPAVEAWLVRFKVGFTGRLPKVKITGKKGMYWCVAEGHPWAGAGDSPAQAYQSWARAVSVQERKCTNPEQRLLVWSDPQ